MKKDSFYKYIIYKIFTSKHKDSFILDGSYGLYLNINSENKRKLGDLDLNEIAISSELVNEDSINKEWNDLYNKFEDIFEQDKNISISWVYKFNTTRTYNINSIGAKLSIKYNDFEVGFDISLLLNDSGAILKSWNIKDESFCKEFNVNKDKEVTIQTFNNEKYFINKTLYVLKESKKFTIFAKDVSKSLYDIWFIITYFAPLRWSEMVNQYDIMYKSDKSLIEFFDETSQYLNKYARVDNQKGWMSSFLTERVNNEDVKNYSIIRVIESYFKNISKIIKEEN